MKLTKRIIALRFGAGKITIYINTFVASIIGRCNSFFYAKYIQSRALLSPVKLVGWWYDWL